MRPGGQNSAGVLTSIAPLTFVPNSQLEFDLAGNTAGTQYDQLSLALTGTVALGGATLTPFLGYNPAPTDSLSILFGSGSSTQITGTFANYPDGALIDLGAHNGQEYAARIHYTPHSVVIDSFIPIPEPGSLALTIFGGAVGLRSVRRRFGVRNITVPS